MTLLRQRFGHEENLSRAILETGLLRGFVKRAGLKPVGKGQLELRVAKGHVGHAGRLDICLSTTSGTVITEVQYGTSDSNHRNRFEGYAKSVSNPALIIWIAESFREKDLKAVAANKTPVVCVKAAISKEGELRLSAIGGARYSTEDAVKKAERAAKQAWKWVKEIDWSYFLTQHALTNPSGGYAEQTLRLSDREWAYKAFTSYEKPFSVQGPTNAKRFEQVKTCSEWSEILDYVASFVPAARIETREMVKRAAKREAVRLAKWEQKMAEDKARQEKEQAAWDAERKARGPIASPEVLSAALAGMDDRMKGMAALLLA